ncbi:MAG: carbohydrate ABC transporter permease [Chloroflexi bacterium]|nr:MAG: carbohydrate ABC transporter permease [Chloroflexota bacterium]
MYTWERRIKAAIPYVIMGIITLPIIVGYVWILISSFFFTTEGLVPKGRFTLEYWRFLVEPIAQRPSIWIITLNTLILALGMAVFVVLISAMAGYALSRLKFPGRKAFLSLTLILHAFPSVTLLIAIFYVLRAIKLYDTITGVVLVQVSLMLPLGVWLMKGFFDNVSWDMERAALIDGCSRLRTWWEILLPNIRPGIAALSIFSFITGWSSFLIPYTFTTTDTKATIAVYLNSLIGDSTFVTYGQVAAVGLFQLIPVMLFFIFSQEYLLNIYTGGTKGGV